jgi:hypothetical protein
MTLCYRMPLTWYPPKANPRPLSGGWPSLQKYENSYITPLKSTKTLTSHFRTGEKDAICWPCSGPSVGNCLLSIATITWDCPAPGFFGNRRQQFFVTAVTVTRPGKNCADRECVIYRQFPTGNEGGNAGAFYAWHFGLPIAQGVIGRITGSKRYGRKCPCAAMEDISYYGDEYPSTINSVPRSGRPACGGYCPSCLGPMEPLPAASQ